MGAGLVERMANALEMTIGALPEGYPRGLKASLVRLVAEARRTPEPPRGPETEECAECSTIHEDGQPCPRCFSAEPPRGPAALDRGAREGRAILLREAAELCVKQGLIATASLIMEEAAALQSPREPDTLLGEAMGALRRYVDAAEAGVGIRHNEWHFDAESMDTCDECIAARARIAAERALLKRYDDALATNPQKEPAR